MDTSNRWFLILVLALLVFAGCTNNTLDDGDSSDVVLVVDSLQTSAVTGQAEVGACSTTTAVECLSNDNCPDTESCILPIAGSACTVTDWTLQLSNLPKTELAGTSPYNDIALTEIDVVYRSALPPNGIIFQRTVPIAGTIPPDTSASIQFEPITFADLTFDNTTINMQARVSGQTLSGDGVSADFGAQLFIEDCLP